MPRNDHHDSVAGPRPYAVGVLAVVLGALVGWEAMGLAGAVPTMSTILDTVGVPAALLLALAVRDEGSREPLPASRWLSRARRWRRRRVE